MHDTPYAFAKQCTWHGHPRDAAPSSRDADPDATGLECPKCGSPVVEVASEASWWNNAERTNRAIPEYAEMMRWSEGMCFPDLDTLQGAYRQHMEGLR